MSLEPHPTRPPITALREAVHLSSLARVKRPLPLVDRYPTCVLPPPERHYRDQAPLADHSPLAVGSKARDDVRMAVLLEFNVGVATQDQFNELDDRVGEAMMQAGGPPPGLLSHVVYPAGDGFIVAEVWRTEPEGRSYVTEVLRPIAEQLGLAPSDAHARPVWSFARP